MTLFLSLLAAAVIWLLALAAVTPVVTRLRLRHERGLKRLAEGGNVAQRQAETVQLRQKKPSRLVAVARFLRRSAPEDLAEGLAPRTVLLTVLGMAVMAFSLRIFFDLSLLYLLPIAAVGAVVISGLILQMRIARRQRQIAERMPEALEMIVRALRVGQPISSALKMTGERIPGALGQELRLTSEKISFGQEIGSALYAMAERTRNTDLRFLAATVSIQMVTGGNLAEVLDRLAGIARARQQLGRKIEAITAEAKWSGRFLSGFPLLAISGVWMVDNNYFDSLVESSAFVPVCIVVATLLVVNVLFMRWLGKID